MSRTPYRLPYPGDAPESWRARPAMRHTLGYRARAPAHEMLLVWMPRIEKARVWGETDDLTEALEPRPAPLRLYVCRHPDCGIWISPDEPTADELAGIERAIREDLLPRSAR